MDSSFISSIWIVARRWVRAEASIPDARLIRKLTDWLHKVPLDLSSLPGTPEVSTILMILHAFGSRGREASERCAFLNQETIAMGEFPSKRFDKQDYVG